MDRLIMLHGDGTEVDKPDEKVPVPSPTRPARPRRAGQPWTDEDYQALVDAVRAGKDLEAIADNVQRQPQAVQLRLVRMLPVEERGCLKERALPALRQHLDDPEYDWQAALLLSLPPRPIVREEHVMTGFSGLPRQDLVTIADALLDHGTPASEELVVRIGAEAGDRVVWRHVEKRVAERMMRRAYEPLSPYEAELRAIERVDRLRLFADDSIRPNGASTEPWADPRWPWSDPL